MTVTVNSLARAESSLSRTAQKQHYFVVVAASLVISNILVFAYHLLDNELYYVSSNAISVALIAYSIVYMINSKIINAAGMTYMLLAASLTSISFVFNWQKASMADSTKYVAIYILFIAGQSCIDRYRPLELRCIYILGILPFVFWLIAGNSGIYAALGYDQAFAYFGSRNAAALYFSALLFALGQRYGSRTLLFQFINIALANKIGVAVATVAAIFFWFARKESVLAIFIFIVCALLAAFAGVFDRTLLAFENLFQSLEYGFNVSVSFAELVKMTGTTDLSVFFRIIHWSDIISIYTSQDIGHILFGYGAGQTPFISRLEFTPHNDYLRVLAEYGILNFIVFICFLYYVLKGLKTKVSRVFFTILLIYFGSENLLDSFTSMAFYFAYAGRFMGAGEIATSVNTPEQ